MPTLSTPNHAAQVLFNKAEMLRIYGMSERKFDELRAAGLVPPAVVLGPKTLRWVAAEVIESLQSLPRATRLPVPEALVSPAVDAIKPPR